MARYLLSAFTDEAGNSLREQIAAAKEHGIPALELRNVDGINISDFTEAQALELKNTLADAKLSVASIGSHYGKKAFDEAAFRQTVAVAQILEAPYIRMFSFYEGTESERIALVKTMAKIAQESGVRCCHENEKGIYGEQPAQCLKLLQACAKENLGCIFDFANFLQSGADIWQAYHLLKPYITYFHIKDLKKAENQLVPAGMGDGQILEILTDFDQSSYGKIFLSVEPHLSVFDGLDKLEQDETLLQRLSEKTAFPSRRAAFDAAVSGLIAVLEQVQPVRLGIIGCGSMGTGHLNQFLDGNHRRLRITAVADLSAEAREKAQKKLPELAIFDTAESLLTSGTCDAVLIATPHYDHPPIAIRALELGLHVLSEKPAGVYTKQVQELISVAKKSDHLYALMYNQRTNPVYRTLKNILDSGKYGEIMRVNWIINNWFRTQYYYDSGDWRATWSGEGGGVLMNQCPHQLDLWQWLCGMPNKIQAHAHEGKWHDIEVEDDVTIYAEYPNGATGVFVATTSEPLGTNRLEITLDKAKIIVNSDNNITIQELETSTKEAIVTTQSGSQCPKSEKHEVPIPKSEGPQHAVVVNHFAQAIISGDKSQLIADGEEGIRGLSICNAAYLSSWLGQAVELPLDENLYWEKLQEKIKSSRRKSRPLTEPELPDSKGYII